MKKTLKAPAKINLCLRVNSKRDDEYHNLTMIMQTISLFDTIDIEIIGEKDFNMKFLKKINNKSFANQSENQINIKCNFSFIPTDEKNLVYKIVRYIYDKYGINDKIFINLKKMIPTSAGLGGGSSDAATVLLFLNKYYKLNLKNEELIEISEKFGSDIAFFIYGKECLCEGKGEKIEVLTPFNNYYVLIATPNIRVSTKEIFSKIDKSISYASKRDLEDIKLRKCLDAINSKNLKLLTKNLFNDLELVTESLYEEISILKDRMVRLGALTSLMSGSGGAVFGIFNSYLKALNCKNKIKNEFSEAFVFISKPI